MKVLVILGHLAVLVLFVVSGFPEVRRDMIDGRLGLPLFYVAISALEILTIIVLIRSRLPGDESYWSLWVRARKERLRREIEGK